LSRKNKELWFLATILILALVNVKDAYAQLPSKPASPSTQSAKPAAATAVLSEAKRQTILKYIRDRFGVPDTVKLTFGELHPSLVAPGFNDATVIVDDGKSPHPQQLLVSRDARFLIVVTGAVMELHEGSAAEMEKRIQEIFKTPASLKVSVGGFKPSPSPDFKQGTLTMDNGKVKQDRTVLLARDGKHLVVSDLYNLTIDPREQALHTISLHDEPTEGPANAPVTLVEYADLQCPTCARMHDFIETKLIPRYGNKLRVVFKEFPLVGMHDWSFTAAIADRCAYELNPAAYVPIRTAIFRNQQLINITNLRETLLSYGEAAGVDRVQLAGCLDAKSSLPSVQRDMDEAKRINVNQTPTAFINGRMMMGLPSEDAYYQAIDAALAGK
jgi:protein-disulfide isomerase